MFAPYSHQEALPPKTTLNLIFSLGFFGAMQAREILASNPQTLPGFRNSQRKLLFFFLSFFLFFLLHPESKSNQVYCPFSSSTSCGFFSLEESSFM